MAIKKYNGFLQLLPTHKKILDPTRILHTSRAGDWISIRNLILVLIIIFIWLVIFSKPVINLADQAQDLLLPKACPASGKTATAYFAELPILDGEQSYRSVKEFQTCFKDRTIPEIDLYPAAIRVWNTYKEKLSYEEPKLIFTYYLEKHPQGDHAPEIRRLLQQADTEYLKSPAYLRSLADSILATDWQKAKKLYYEAYTSLVSRPKYDAGAASELAKKYTRLEADKIQHAGITGYQKFFAEPIYRFLISMGETTLPSYEYEITVTADPTAGPTGKKYEAKIFRDTRLLNAGAPGIEKSANQETGAQLLLELITYCQKIRCPTVRATYDSVEIDVPFPEMPPTI